MNLSFLIWRIRRPLIYHSRWGHYARHHSLCSASFTVEVLWGQLTSYAQSRLTKTIIKLKLLSSYRRSYNFEQSANICNGCIHALKNLQYLKDTQAQLDSSYRAQLDFWLTLSRIGCGARELNLKVAKFLKRPLTSAPTLSLTALARSFLQSAVY